MRRGDANWIVGKELHVIHACVMGSIFNKYLAACKSAELIDRTHKQLKRITFVKQRVYSVCNQGKYPA